LCTIAEEASVGRLAGCGKTVVTKNFIVVKTYRALDDSRLRTRPIATSGAAG
jgi:hypothetical protein